MKKVLHWMIRCIISFGILFYLIRYIPLEKLLTTVASANLGYILLAILLTQIMYYLSAVKAKILTDELALSLSISKIFEINYVTKFYGMFFPEIISGGLIRWHKLSTPDRKPAEALASMVFNRVTEIIILVGMGLLFWILSSPPDASDILGIALVVMFAGSMIFHYVIFHRKISVFLIDKINSIHYIPKYLADKISKLLWSTSHYHGLKRSSLVQVLGLNILQHLIGITSFYLFARSIDINITFSSLGWIRSYIHILCMLPISISGLGIQEGSLVYLLNSYGISSTSAVVLSLLLHIRTIIGGTIGGIIEATNFLRPNKRRTEEKHIA